MNTERYKEASDKICKFIEENFPDLAYTVVASDNQAPDLMITGNACIACLVKMLVIEIIRGNLTHLDNHIKEDITVVDLDETSKIH